MGRLRKFPPQVHPGHSGSCGSDSPGLGAPYATPHHGVCNIVSQATLRDLGSFAVAVSSPLLTEALALHGTRERQQVQLCPPTGHSPREGGELLFRTRVLAGWLKPGGGFRIEPIYMATDLSLSLSLCLRLVVLISFAGLYIWVYMGVYSFRFLFVFMYSYLYCSIISTLSYCRPYLLVCKASPHCLDKVRAS